MTSSKRGSTACSSSSTNYRVAPALPRRRANDQGIGLRGPQARLRPPRHHLPRRRHRPPRRTARDGPRRPAEMTPPPPRGTDYGMLMAASTLMTIPVMLLFFAGQRYFIEGVTLTGM